MTVTFTDSATDAITAEADYYTLNQGPEAAARWEAAVGMSIDSLRSMTERGALLRTKRRNLAGLRWILVHGFPFRLFYVFEADKAELCVVSLIHERRKIDDLLQTAIAETPKP